MFIDCFQDIGSIDETLTATLLDVLQIGLTLIAIIIVVGVVNPWILLPTLLIGVVFQLMRMFYLKTSRSVKRLEGISKYTFYFLV